MKKTCLAIAMPLLMLSFPIGKAADGDKAGLAQAVRISAPAPQPEVVGEGPDVARQALLDAGATWDEAEFGVKICKRESRCTLDATNFNRRTKDDSHGPWQVNYWGSLRQARIDLIGPTSANTSSWASAAAAFLVLLRHDGRCAWTPPRYCYG